MSVISHLVCVTSRVDGPWVWTYKFRRESHLLLCGYEPTAADEIIARAAHAPALAGLPATLQAWRAVVDAISTNCPTCDLLLTAAKANELCDEYIPGAYNIDRHRLMSKISEAQRTIHGGL